MVAGSLLPSFQDVRAALPQGLVLAVLFAGWLRAQVDDALFCLRHVRSEAQHPLVVFDGLGSVLVAVVRQRQVEGGAGTVGVERVD